MGVLRASATSLVGLRKQWAASLGRWSKCGISVRAGTLDRSHGVGCRLPIGVEVVVPKKPCQTIFVSRSTEPCSLACPQYGAVMTSTFRPTPPRGGPRRPPSKSAYSMPEDVTFSRHQSINHSSSLAQVLQCQLFPPRFACSAETAVRTRVCEFLPATWSEFRPSR